MAKSSPSPLAVLAEMRQVTGRGRGRRSEVYRWMSANYATLSAEFVKEPPSWTNLAKVLAKEGMTTADGLPPTAASVRSTWIRVEQGRQRKAAGRRQGAHETPGSPSEPEQPGPSQAEPNDDPSDPLPDDFEFKPIRNKGT